MNVRAARSGYTLIEVCVGMTVTASVLLLSVQLIHRGLRHASIVRSEQNERRSLQRFSATLRDDIHRASTIVAASDSRLELAMSESETIAYQIDVPDVLRTVTVGDQQETQIVLRVGEEHVSRFEAVQSKGQVSFQLQHYQAINLPDSPVAYRVSAVLGLRNLSDRDAFKQETEAGQ